MSIITLIRNGFRFIGLVLLGALLAACGGGDSGGTTPAPTFLVGGTVSGLDGVLVLQNNGGDDLSVTVNGAFVFPAYLATGATYSVSVKSQPKDQLCEVVNGAGTVGSANVLNVAVSCIKDKGEWSSLAPIPEPSYGLGGAFVGGKFYAISGFRTTRLAVYNPASNTWASAAPLNFELSSYTYAGQYYAIRQYFGTAVLNEEIYVVGGDTGGEGDLNTLYRYNPVSNEWTSLAPMPLGKRWALGAAAINGKVYAVGGYSLATSSYLNRLEVYDPASNSWTIKMPMPTPRAGALVGAIGGKLYVAGGFDKLGWMTNLEIYDPATDTWSPGPSMPSAENGNGVVLGNRLFSIGGGSNGEHGVFAYDAATKTWLTDFAPMPTGRHDIGVAADENSNRIYAVGGWKGGYISALEVFTAPPGIANTP